ncbi:MULTISPECIES: diaminopimelate dehydrogenase [unclassified Jeotgalibaca]|uniref:diaminopimelate dehydrogenase n=1 Tax=unclassified Jeotgalibaca TaxID=2621505 RepID=UPI003FD49298
MVNKKTRIGIVGYGNLGKGVEEQIQFNEDLELVGIFSRRKPESVESENPVFHMDDLVSMKDAIDVLLLCGGSATDIPEQAPVLQESFNTVNAYDNHAEIPAHFEILDEIALRQGNVAIVATGWDPGLFSLNRLISEAILPKGETYTFWGKGVSQGHSDAIRRVEGVKRGVQYTIPNESLIKQIKDGEQVVYTKTSSHKRVCYVVAEVGADEPTIAETISTMKDYFADYETEVHFIDEETFERDHGGIPHGGHVIRRGYTAEDTMAVYELNLDLGSNPGFTAAVMVAYARAAHRLASEGIYGAKSVFDVAPSYLSPKTSSQLRKELL